MSKIFVIAGTREEFNAYVKSKQQNNLVGPDYKFVSNCDDVKGYTNPHGVFVGNWLGRPDIFEIVEALMMRSTHVNPALGKIWQQVKPKTRPTAKLKPVPGGWINEELVKKINGGVI